MLSLPPSKPAVLPRQKVNQVQHILRKNFGRGTPAEAFSGAIIDQVSNLIYNALRDRAEIKALREKEPQQVICVFVRAALPRFMRLGKIDQRTELFLQSAEFRKLRAVIQADGLDGQPLENLTDHIPRVLHFEL